MMSWIGLHKFAGVVFGVTLKPLYITPSNLVRWFVTNKEVFMNLFPGPSWFWKLCPFKRTRFERKSKVNFFEIFLIIPFQNILFSNRFFACNGCLRLFTKIEKGSGTSFWCKFSTWFFHKNVPYLMLYQLTKFHCHTFFSFQGIK